jgi:hypothetical protein
MWPLDPTKTAHFAVATKYIQWLGLGAIALRQPGKLMWDANKRRFSNSEEANRYLKPFLRQGWEGSFLRSFACPWRSGLSEYSACTPCPFPSGGVSTFEDTSAGVLAV